jgi:tetratricopeptide (TPR) repeat protein
LKKAVEMRPDKASAHNNLGLSYFEREDFEEAFSEFNKAIQFEKHSFHFNNRGLANYHIGKLEDAKKDYDEAIAMNPEDPFFYFNRGNVYLNQGEFELAH